MHIFYCFLLSLSFALCQQSNNPQSNNPPFKIAISAESPTVVAGSGVSIKVSLTNTSNQELDDSGSWITGIPLDPNFRFEVRDEHGKVIPTYPPPKMGYTGYPINRTISPKQTLTQEQLVSGLYDMRKPGKYIIRVSRRASDNPKDGEIKSNIITVTVIPKDKVPLSKSVKVR